MPELKQATAYEAAVRSLYERINYEKTGHPPYSDSNYRLDRMRRLLTHLDDPHLASPVIHIAGTKGKGSTANLIARMLSASGYRTGLYTSPHLVHLEERFQMDAAPCTPEQLIELVEELQAAAEKIEREGGGRPTFFELTTALAFLHFAKRNAQLVVLEVGLGGRLDSTNVCEPTVTAITTIGMDHQAQLGNTIAAIAGEKAGIIKRGIPIVSSARHPDARRVIEQRARELGAPLRLIDREFSCSWTAIAPQDGQLAAPCASAIFLPGYAESMVGPSRWSLSLLGQHHADNLANAIAVMDLLSQKGWSSPYAVLAEAVAHTTIPARLQIVGHSPVQLIDAAHNPDSIAAALQAVAQHFPGKPAHFVLASSRDKDIEAMLRMLVPAARTLILTQYHNNPRGLPVEDMVAIADRLAPTCELLTAPNPMAAWQLAMTKARADELVCATGSFFLAAELLDELRPEGYCQ